MEPPIPRPLGPHTSPTSPAPPLSSPPNAPLSLCKIPSSSPSRIVEDFNILSRNASPGSPPSPKLKEQPVMRGSPATMIARKRRLLEAENEGVSPQKRAKTLLTSVSGKEKARGRRSTCAAVLELARATRATFTAHVEYQRLRTKELELIQAMAVDDCEEAEELLREAELQAGHIKGSSISKDVVSNILNDIVNNPCDSDTSADSSDGRSSLLPCRFSRSPSADTSSDL